MESWWLWKASPICLRLFRHLLLAAAARIFCTAGSKRPTRTAMMAITTSNSTSVNPLRLPGFGLGKHFMFGLQIGAPEEQLLHGTGDQPAAERWPFHAASSL